MLQNFSITSLTTSWSAKVKQKIEIKMKVFLQVFRLWGENLHFNAVQ